MKKMYLTIALVSLCLYGIAQDTLLKKPAKDTLQSKEKPIADSIAYITNDDINGIYKYIGDRTSGSQFMEIIAALKGAITEVKQKAESRYRKKKKG